MGVRGEGSAPVSLAEILCGCFELTSLDSRIGIYGMSRRYSVDLYSECIDDRHPQSKVGCKRLPEFFGV